MNKRILWKVGGEAGFGIMTTGLTFAKIATRSGYHIFDYFEYPSLIRGGHNTYEVLVSEDEVYMSQQNIDVLVCLNKETYETHKHRLQPHSIVIYNSNDFQISESIEKINITFRDILNEHEASLVMMNNIALGASLAALGWNLDTLFDMIEETFGKKGEAVVAINKKLAQAGYDIVSKTKLKVDITLSPKEKEDRLVLTGNDAFALATVAADCRFYVAYPMTPSSTVLTTLADYAVKTGMVVRHAEDEISVINTALGGSFMGVRSSVGTSGGGFALMVESLSYAGVAEIPIVVFLSQRPGPATGLPTWTEQGDLLFAVHAGHGEFPKIVLAPGDIQEMITLTTQAFDLADIYQTPVIIMSDKHLSESHQSVSEVFFTLLIKSYKPDRGKITMNVKSSYLRYKITDDGISPMLVPGLSGHFYQANSYEHLQDGHTTEDAQARIDQVDKRNRKEKTYLSNHFRLPQVIGDIEKAKIVFVSWGSPKGAILEAMRVLQEKGVKTALIHFTHLYPMDEQKVCAMMPEGKNYILVENNSHAQFGRLLRQLTGITIKKKLLKYDGRPIWPEEILHFVEKLSI